MSFAVWNDKPPFEPSGKDQLYAGLVNSVTGEPVYVVTDQGQPTQQQVDAVINPPPVPTKPTVDAVVAAIRATDGPLAQALDTAVASEGAVANVIS